MLHEWALAWGIPFAALQDLRGRLGVLDWLPTAEGRSEGAVSNAVRLEASRKGMRLWRNNVGVLQDNNGRPVRFGLANDSPQVNKVLKSGDLIGIDPVVITPGMVGSTIGRFLSVETKPEGWHFTGTPREEAQQSWALFVASMGGRALFANREGLL
jgi:hypothetical protein